jgi:hypothetical protein
MASLKNLSEEIDSVIDLTDQLVKDWSVFGPYTPDLRQRVSIICDRSRGFPAYSKSILSRAKSLESRVTSSENRPTSLSGEDSKEFWKLLTGYLDMVLSSFKHREFLNSIHAYEESLRKYPFTSLDPFHYKYHYKILGMRQKVFDQSSVEKSSLPLPDLYNSFGNNFYSNADELVFASEEDGRLCLHPFYTMISGKVIINAEYVVFNPLSMRAEISGPIQIISKTLEKPEGKLKQGINIAVLKPIMFDIGFNVEKTESDITETIEEAGPDIDRLIKIQIPIDREVLERDYKLRVRLDYQEQAKRLVEERALEDMKRDVVSNLEKAMRNFSVDGRIIVAHDKKHLGLVRDIHYDSDALKEFGRLLNQGEISIIENNTTIMSDKKFELELRKK